MIGQFVIGSSLLCFRKKMMVERMDTNTPMYINMAICKYLSNCVKIEEFLMTFIHANYAMDKFGNRS